MYLEYPADCNPIDKLDQLTFAGILDPNITFTGCLPQCGICSPAQRSPDYASYNLVVVGMILPLIGCLGLVGNGISAFVYSRPEMRQSTNLYLCALGCSDSAVIATGLFLFFIDSVRQFSYSLTRIFGLFSPIVYPMGMTAQTCSVYFTICAGFDCFIQVCLSQKIKETTSSGRFIRNTILCVILFSILYNIPHCFEGVVIDCYHKFFHGPSWEVCPSTFRYNPLYQVMYYNYMYSIFLAVGPLVILVILNTIIIGASVCGTSNVSFGDTISLVLVVLLFIFCNVAALLLNIFEEWIESKIGSDINYIVDLSNVLVVFNSSFNFVIYVIFSASFSTTLKKYFGGRKKKDNCVNNPSLVVTEKASNTKLCKETLGRLLTASQPEVSRRLCYQESIDSPIYKSSQSPL